MLFERTLTFLWWTSETFLLSFRISRYVLFCRKNGFAACKAPMQNPDKVIYLPTSNIGFIFITNSRTPFVLALETEELLKSFLSCKLVFCVVPIWCILYFTFSRQVFDCFHIRVVSRAHLNYYYSENFITIISCLHRFFWCQAYQLIAYSRPTCIMQPFGVVCVKLVYLAAI